MLDVSYERPDLALLRSSGKFVADMHYHTAYSHDCRTPVADILKLARKLGVTLTFTDHNTISGLLEAKKRRAKVIPSIEICSREGKEVIPYFYDLGQLEEFFAKVIKQNIRQQNALQSSRTTLPMVELLEALKDEECVTTLPHPFIPGPRRSYTYFTRRSTLLRAVDAVEVYNMMCSRRQNVSALGFAVEFSKSMTGGSDGHELLRLGAGVTISNATSVEEHLKLIKKGKVAIRGGHLSPAERAWTLAIVQGQWKLRKGVRGAFDDVRREVRHLRRRKAR